MTGRSAEGGQGEETDEDGEVCREARVGFSAFGDPEGHWRGASSPNLSVKEGLLDKHCGHRQRNPATAET